jgi:hypothetical protein
MLVLGEVVEDFAADRLGDVGARLAQEERAPRAQPNVGMELREVALQQRVDRRGVAASRALDELLGVGAQGGVNSGVITGRSIATYPSRWASRGAGVAPVGGAPPRGFPWGAQAAHAIRPVADRRRPAARGARPEYTALW